MKNTYEIVKSFWNTRNIQPDSLTDLRPHLDTATGVVSIEGRGRSIDSNGKPLTIDTTQTITVPALATAGKYRYDLIIISDTGTLSRVEGTEIDNDSLSGSVGQVPVYATLIGIVKVSDAGYELYDWRNMQTPHFVSDTSARKLSELHSVFGMGEWDDTTTPLPTLRIYIHNDGKHISDGGTGADGNPIVNYIEICRFILDHKLTAMDCDLEFISGNGASDTNGSEVNDHKVSNPADYLFYLEGMHPDIDAYTKLHSQYKPTITLKRFYFYQPHRESYSPNAYFKIKDCDCKIIVDDFYFRYADTSYKYSVWVLDNVFYINFITRFDYFIGNTNAGVGYGIQLWNNTHMKMSVQPDGLWSHYAGLFVRSGSVLYLDYDSTVNQIDITADTNGRVFINNSRIKCPINFNNVDGTAKLYPYRGYERFPKRGTFYISYLNTYFKIGVMNNYTLKIYATTQPNYYSQGYRGSSSTDRLTLGDVFNFLNKYVTNASGRQDIIIDCNNETILLEGHYSRLSLNRITAITSHYRRYKIVISNLNILMRTEQYINPCIIITDCQGLRFQNCTFTVINNSLYTYPYFWVIVNSDVEFKNCLFTNNKDNNNNYYHAYLMISCYGSKLSFFNTQVRSDDNSITNAPVDRFIDAINSEIYFKYSDCRIDARQYGVILNNSKMNLASNSFINAGISEIIAYNGSFYYYSDIQAVDKAYELVNPPDVSITETVTLGEDVVTGDILVMDNSGNAVKALATTHQFVDFISNETKSSGSDCTVTAINKIITANITFDSADIGKNLYLSDTTAGTYITTPPTAAGTHVVRIGRIVATDKLLFAPQYLYSN